MARRLKEDAWVGLLAMECRREAVRRCLSGNDTQCFTIEQYQKAYDEVWKTPHKAVERLWASGLAEKHLRSLGDEVREVRPGVWTGKPEQ